MKLPQTSHPVERSPSRFHEPAGVGPSQVQPQANLPPLLGSHRKDPWQSGSSTKGSGQCACVRKGNTWYPTQNNCGFSAAPQCNATGQCNCVRRNEQRNAGTAADASGMQNVINSIGFGFS